MYAIREVTPGQASFLSGLVDSALPSILLDIHGVRIHVHSNLQETIDLIREGYSFFETGAGGADGPHHILSLSSDGPGYEEIARGLFPDGPVPPHCLIPLDYRRVYCIHSGYVLNYFTGGFFTAMMEASLYDDYLIIHGAGLVKDGRGVIFPGALRCGKSTLTLYLLYQGFRFASDDILLVNRRTLEVHPYPRLINIRKDSLTIVPGIHKDYHRMKFSQSFDEPRWFLDKSELAAEPFRCHYVIFPQIGQSGPPRMIPIPKTEAAFELIRNAFYPITPTKRFGSTGENLPTVSRLLEDALCYRFIQGEPESNFKLIRETLGV